MGLETGRGGGEPEVTASSACSCIKILKEKEISLRERVKATIRNKELCNKLSFLESSGEAGL